MGAKRTGKIKARIQCPVGVLVSLVVSMVDVEVSLRTILSENGDQTKYRLTPCSRRHEGHLFCATPRGIKIVGPAWLVRTDAVSTGLVVAA